MIFGWGDYAFADSRGRLSLQFNVQYTSRRAGACSEPPKLDKLALGNPTRSRRVGTMLHPFGSSRCRPLPRNVRSAFGGGRGFQITVSVYFPCAILRAIFRSARGSGGGKSCCYRSRPPRLFWLLAGLYGGAFALPPKIGAR